MTCRTGVDHHQVRRPGRGDRLSLSFALEFQLIGGMVIIQILPALVLGLYTRWYHRWSLVAGWIVGMGLPVYMLYVTPSKTAAHFGSASFMFKTRGFDTKMTIWTGIVGLIANLIVATALNPLFRRLPHGHDETIPADYEIEGPGRANRSRRRTSSPRHVTRGAVPRARHHRYRGAWTRSTRASAQATKIGMWIWIGSAADESDLLVQVRAPLQ